jgi:hypothetical protein
MHKLDELIDGYRDVRMCCRLDVLNRWLYKSLDYLMLLIRTKWTDTTYEDVNSLGAGPFFKTSWPLSCFTLRMEAGRSSETSVTYHITKWCHNPEEGELHVDREISFCILKFTVTTKPIAVYKDLGLCGTSKQVTHFHMRLYLLSSINICTLLYIARCCCHSNACIASIFNELQIPGLSKTNTFQDLNFCLCFAQGLMKPVMYFKLITNCTWRRLESSLKIYHHSARQEMPLFLCNPTFPNAEVPPKDPILTHLHTVHTHTHTHTHYSSKILFNVISHLLLGLPNGLYPSVFIPTFCSYFLFTTCILYAPPISMFII